MTLAIKYRPLRLDQVYSQEVAVKLLSNALQEPQKLPNAILLTGTRGTGKTTIARIMALSLLCEKGISSQPCLECLTCRSIINKTCQELIEVDAASNTKVDEIKPILQRAQYKSMGSYKIFIIDEVHMLSKHSFNAMLKILEDTPENVLFILATTEPKKIPVTILSRCLQIHLKNIPIFDICEYLAYVLDSENIPYERHALYKIANAAKGSMRDALSILDGAICLGNEINEELVYSQLNLIDDTVVHSVINALVNQDVNELIAIAEIINTAGYDYMDFIDELLSLVHKISVSLACGTDEYKDVTDHIKEQDLINYYNVLIEGKRQLPMFPDQKIGFEMVMLRLIYVRDGLRLGIF